MIKILYRHSPQSDVKLNVRSLVTTPGSDFAVICSGIQYQGLKRNNNKGQAGADNLQQEGSQTMNTSSRKEVIQIGSR
jgi:hypothetical protein